MLGCGDFIAPWRNPVFTSTEMASAGEFHLALGPHPGSAQTVVIDAVVVCLTLCS